MNLGESRRSASIAIDAAVDTGFIALNELNHPNPTALFRVVEIPTQESDMSFAVSTAPAPSHAISS
jgi:predicted NAD/FAD-binding protein